MRIKHWPVFDRTDWLLGLGTLAVAQALRHFVIEPNDIGHACDPAPWSGACAVRTAIVMSFRRMELGWIAAAAGALCWILLMMRQHVPARWSARVALVLGTAGLVLYSYDPAVVGFISALAFLVRPRTPAGSLTAL